jgi:signal transduction histidine kinase
VSHGGWRSASEITGIGMEPEDVSRALEPFVQVAHITTVEGWGTGLGLPLAKSLIQALGGSFHIESHPGIGTCALGRVFVRSGPVAKAARAERRGRLTLQAGFPGSPR